MDISCSKKVWIEDVHVKGINSHEKISSIRAIGASLSSQNLIEYLFLPELCPDVLIYEQGLPWSQTVSFLPFKYYHTVLFSCK